MRSPLLLFSEDEPLPAPPLTSMNSFHRNVLLGVSTATLVGCGPEPAPPAIIGKAGHSPSGTPPVTSAVATALPGRTPISEWAQQMDAAAADFQDGAQKEEARFQALKRLLLSADISDYASAVEAIKSHYQTNLQASLMETLAASLASRGHTAQQLYAIISDFPAGMSKWVSLRAVGLNLPEDQFLALLDLCDASAVPEERMALADALRGRLAAAGSGSFDRFMSASGKWPEEVRRVLMEKLPAVVASRADGIRSGLAQIGSDSNMQMQFLGEFGLRHPGAVFSYFFEELPIESLTTSQALLAVNDGIRDPQKTASALTGLQSAKSLDVAAVTDEFVRQWLEHDPEAASGWVRAAGRDNSAILKGGATAIVRYLQGKNEDSSLEVWRSILDGAKGPGQ